MNIEITQYLVLIDVGYLQLCSITTATLKTMTAAKLLILIRNVVFVTMRWKKIGHTAYLAADIHFVERVGHPI